MIQRAPKVGAVANRKIRLTMIATQPTTMDAFLAQLEATDGRLEFYGGEVVAMSGGTAAHSGLAVRLTALLVPCVHEPCAIYDKDLAIRFDDVAYVFPDLSVTCEAVDDTTTALRAPKFVLEVLSPSTSARDRAEKLDLYQSLASLQEYLLVDSRRRWVCLFRRADDHWTEHVYATDDASISLASVGLTVTLGELYGTFLARPK